MDMQYGCTRALRGVLTVCVCSKSKYSKNPVVEQHVGWLMAPADLVSTPTPSPSTHPGMANEFESAS